MDISTLENYFIFMGISIFEPRSKLFCIPITYNSLIRAGVLNKKYIVSINTNDTYWLDVLCFKLFKSDF